MKEAGLTPVFKPGIAYFEQAQTVLVCRKLYRQPMCEECFLDRELMQQNYPERDFHITYVAEIEKVYLKS